MRVKPTRDGLLVKCPVSKLPVPPEGREVPETGYWLRRVRDGSLERMADEAPAPTPQPKPKPRVSSKAPKATDKL